MAAIMITFCLLMVIAFTFYSNLCIPKFVRDYCDEDLFDQELEEYLLNYVVDDQ